MDYKDSTIKNLKTLVIKAIDTFIREDKGLIQRELSERALCGALIIRLYEVIKTSIYSDYYVDVEFNRRKTRVYNDVKRLLNDKGKLVNITTDIIVHGRGELPEGKTDNLIAIEMKKCYGNTKRYDNNKRNDIYRLECLTQDEASCKESSEFEIIDRTNFQPYAYKLGVFCEIKYKSKKDKSNSISCEFYSLGHKFDYHIIEDAF